MSHWNIGAHNVSEETQAFRDKLASKDTQIAAQQTQLLRQAAELEEIRTSLNDALHKLTRETDRAMALEKILSKCTDDLRNEKTAVHNSSLALETAHRELRAKDLENKELLSHLDKLSHQSDEQKTRTALVEKDKTTLSNRVRELETNIKMLNTAPVTPGKIPRSIHRPRSSSLSNMRITTLEIELQDLRGQVTAKDLELRNITQKLGMEVTNVENAKGSIERAMKKRVAELETALEEKEDELAYLRDGACRNGDREAELMARIDEDEAKIHALEMLISDTEDIEAVRDTLRRTEQQLASERQRLFECTTRQVELVQEKEEILDELEDARNRVMSLDRTVEEQETLISALKRNVTDLHASQSSNGSLQHFASNQQTVEDIERLLSAVNRLRQERDEVRRQMKFLEMEHKFNLEELEKLRIAPATPLAPSEYFDIYAHDLTITALGIVVNHLRSQSDATLEKLRHRQSALEAGEAAFERLRIKAEANAQLLQEVEAERDALLTRTETDEADWTKDLDDTKGSHQETNQLDSQFRDLSSTLMDVESERDSLRLQVENLTTDLASAQDELQEAESRYSTLQFHQLSTMSSNEATRALRDQMEEMERRVMRRNEQIGLHQHDIKRMETNLRLQEERIIELTSELETMLEEKNAMVEDCADAREARDDAVARCEALEIETETIQDEGLATETLVKVFFDLAERSRSTIRRLTSDFLESKAYVAHLERDRTEALHSVEKLSIELQETSTKLFLSDANVQQATITLANAQLEVNRLLSSSHSANDTRLHFEQRVSQLQEDLAVRISERDALGGQLDDLQRDMSASETSWASRISELEQALAHKKEAMILMESNHRVALKDALLQISEKEKHLANSSVEQEQLVQLKMKHVEEMGALHSRVIESTSLIEEIQTRYDACEAEREEYRKELDEAKAEIIKQVGLFEDGQSRYARLSQELQRVTQTFEEERSHFTESLETVKTALGDAEAARDELDALHRAHISQSQQENDGQLRQLRDELEHLGSQCDHQAAKLNDALADAEALRSSLSSECTARAAERELHSEQHAEIEERCRALDVLNNELSRDIENAQIELNSAHDQIEALQTDITSYQQDNTALEAEVQREMSMTRYLQSQVKELQESLTHETATHQQCRTMLARTEKSANTAEVNFNMQTSHHRRELSQAQRELAILKAKPNLEHIIAELEERNNELEELLRTKCSEIEENDDKTLVMLKENKKLASKVEALTRKVHNLQTKLAAAKASDTPSVPQAASSRAEIIASSSSSRVVSPAPSVPSIPAMPRSRSSTLTSPVEPTFTAPTSSRPPPRSRPPSLASSSSVPRINPPSQASSSRMRSTTLFSAMPPTPPDINSTPNSRTYGNRVASGPSALPRPKTPERRVLSRTGFRSASPEKDAPSSSAGKKRAAPDDWADIPAQAFTVDSVPDAQAEPGTPRLQKVMNSIHTGFTPRRHTGAKPLISLSPTKRATPFMSDLTNNPDLLEDKPLKRSWLGKIRGTSTQVGAIPLGRS